MHSGVRLDGCSGAQYVTAVAPHIDVWPDLSDRVKHRFLGPPKVDMAATSGDHFDGRGRRPMFDLKPAQCGFGVKTIHVDDEGARRWSGSGS